MAANPDIALTLLLHKLVSDIFRHRSVTGALDATVRHVFFPVQEDGLADSPSAKAVAARHATWAAEIPTDDPALWDWLHELAGDRRLALLAHCVSFGVNALHEKLNPYGAGLSAHGLKARLDEADRLARATGLDMAADGWRPTAENYLGRVTKAGILDAVREGAGGKAAERITHLKKSDMAKEAEQLLAGTGWLPQPLRLAQANAGNGTPVSTPDAVSDSDEVPPAVIDEREHDLNVAEAGE